MKKYFGLLFLVAFGLVSCTGDDAPTGPTFDEQLKKDIAAVDLYLDSKGIKAQTDPDNYGVKYIVNVEGTGIKPASPADSVVVNYTLKLLPSESQVEKSTAPVKFLLGNLIPGWQIGLPLIKSGSKATLYIPSGWGYGPLASGSIPGNSNLIFEIELIRVSPQLTRDTIAISSYLDLKNITNALKDPSGLRYVITQAGTGANPTSTSTISFKYVGKRMSSESIFDQSNVAVSYELSKLIKGFQIAMPLLQVGTKATLYIPSTLGYGLRGSNSVPSNANLIFDVELVSTN
jgi:FKBP-type peptidyl-prolyl cis-trans isomerase FkpA